MQALRKAAEASKALPPLSWRDEDDDECRDWRILLSAGSYRVHSAVVASGPRRSELLRDSVSDTTKALKGARTTDLTHGGAWPTTDSRFITALELILDWMYSGATLVSAEDVTAATAVATVAATPTKSRAPPPPPPLPPPPPPPSALLRCRR